MAAVCVLSVTMSDWIGASVVVVAVVVVMVTVHGIITQVRVGKHDVAHSHVVPTMSPVFEFGTSNVVKKRRRLTTKNNDVENLIRPKSASSGTYAKNVTV